MLHIEQGKGERACIDTFLQQRVRVVTHRHGILLYIVRETLAGYASIRESPAINSVNTCRILHRNVTCDTRFTGVRITEFCLVIFRVMSQAPFTAAWPDALAFGCIGSRHVCSFG